jgi:hypothetical protein
MNTLTGFVLSTGLSLGAERFTGMTWALKGAADRTPKSNMRMRGYFDRVRFIIAKIYENLITMQS